MAYRLTKMIRFSCTCIVNLWKSFESQHDKTNKMCAPSEDSDHLGICLVWSESSLSAWRNIGSLATHWAHSEDSDQTGRMPRLIWVFAWHKCHFVGGVVTTLLISSQDWLSKGWRHSKTKMPCHAGYRLSYHGNTACHCARPLFT